MLVLLESSFLFFSITAYLFYVCNEQVFINCIHIIYLISKAYTVWKVNERKKEKENTVINYHTQKYVFRLIITTLTRYLNLVPLPTSIPIEAAIVIAGLTHQQCEDVHMKIFIFLKHAAYYHIIIYQIISHL